jgi:hypothetical protein
MEFSKGYMEGSEIWALLINNLIVLSLHHAES